jgi:hypothetical protein
MTMKRRNFLQLAALSGLSVAAPFSLSRKALADESLPALDSPFYVTVHAGGGWDPTSFCDPKGRINDEQENPVNMYYVDDIKQIGNHIYAPVAGAPAFFEKYYKQLVVINGVDMATNGHDSGTRNAWSGTLMEGYPSFAALVAGVNAPEKPMSYLTNGGYDYSAGLVSPTRVGNTAALSRLAKPHLIDPNKEDRFHTEATEARIRALRDKRLSERMAKTTLPRYQHAMNMLWTVRQGSNELKLLQEFLPATLDNTGNQLKRQAQLAVAAYRAGLAVSANLTLGGFDTHSNHDTNQFARLTMLLEGVDFLMEEAILQGVADKMIVLIGSDFGRTPSYNDGNGKDHWSVSSFMAMGAGIAGNRVVGASTPYHKPLTVNPETLALDENGIRITPGHINAALRALAGIDNDILAAQYPLKEGLLPIFTG